MHNVIVGTAGHVDHGKTCLIKACLLYTSHICEDGVKSEVDEGVYDEQISMMEMVLDVDDITKEMTTIREEFCKYL